jgi:hypothetical protein
MISISELYPWFIVAMSVLGAKCASSGDRLTRKYGFCIWVLSNGLIGYDYYMNGEIAKTILFLVLYQYYNIKGIWNNR